MTTNPESANGSHDHDPQTEAKYTQAERSPARAARATKVARKAIEASASTQPGEPSDDDEFEDIDIDIDDEEVDIARDEEPAQESIRAYLNGIGKVKLLTADQEVKLAKAIEAGLAAENKLEGMYIDQEALSELLRAQRRMVQEYGGRWPTTAELAAELGMQPHDVEYAQLYADYKTVASEGAKAKNDFLEANLRLVVSIARRYANKRQIMGFLDLIQEGNLGLVRAVEKFDYTKGFKFSTYATWWIRQAVARGIADQDRTVRIPVWMIERIDAYGRQYRRFAREFGRAPNDSEMARELGIDEEEVREVKSYLDPPVSLDMRVGVEGSELGSFIHDPDDPSVLDIIVEADAEQRLVDLIARLPSPTREAARMYFLSGPGMTIARVAERLGRSREWVNDQIYMTRATLTLVRRAERGEVVLGTANLQQALSPQAHSVLQEVYGNDQDAIERALLLTLETLGFNRSRFLRGRHGIYAPDSKLLVAHPSSSELSAMPDITYAIFEKNLEHVVHQRWSEIDLGVANARARSAASLLLELGYPLDLAETGADRTMRVMELLRTPALTEEDKRLIIGSYGLDGNPPKSVAEMAAEFREKGRAKVNPNTVQTRLGRARKLLGQGILIT